jgi:hypothetical protein
MQMTNWPAFPDMTDVFDVSWWLLQYGKPIIRDHFTIRVTSKRPAKTHCSREWRYGVVTAESPVEFSIEKLM